MEVPNQTEVSGWVDQGFTLRRTLLLSQIKCVCGMQTLIDIVEITKNCILRWLIEKMNIVIFCRVDQDFDQSRVPTLLDKLLPVPKARPCNLDANSQVTDRDVIGMFWADLGRFWGKHIISLTSSCLFLIFIF